MNARSSTGAKLQPRRQYGTSDTLLVGPCKICAMLYGAEFGACMDHGTDTRLEEEIAKTFDHLPGTGQLDDLLETPSDGG